MKSTEKVQEYMDKLDHPFKDEVVIVREIIKGVDTEIAEEIKWNAPSYSYHGEYIVTFNLRARDNIHLVFHNKNIANVKSKLLEGDYVDRRMLYFKDMEDIKSNKKELEKIIQECIEFIRVDLKEENKFKI